MSDHAKNLPLHVIFEALIHALHIFSQAVILFFNKT